MTSRDLPLSLPSPENIHLTPITPDDEAAAIRHLRRLGALDLAEVLGLGGAA